MKCSCTFSIGKLLLTYHDTYLELLYCTRLEITGTVADLDFCRWECNIWKLSKACSFVPLFLLCWNLFFSWQYGGKKNHIPWPLSTFNAPHCCQFGNCCDARFSRRELLSILQMFSLGLHIGDRRGWDGFSGLQISRDVRWGSRGRCEEAERLLMSRY